MNTFYRLFLRLRVFFVFLILEIITLVLLSNSSYFQQATVVGNIRLVKARIDGIWDNGIYYFSLKKTNEQLAQENAELRSRLQYYQEKSNTPVEATVTDSADAPVYSYVSARIVANSVNTLHNYMTLNVGSQQGIEPDMGVIVHDGIVGLVVTVYEHYSLVKSLLNVNWQVSAKLAGNGFFGSLYWDGKDDREVILTEIPQHVAVHVGDTVISSGLSSIFPSDIPIGTVNSYQIKGGNFYEITVSLFADFRKMYAVHVVKHLYRDERKTLEASKRYE
ncbi:MAG: rod shape-determining protein MreC [Prevotellaceae bacterium]|jgi:rod shape-determining protein MreC|nr:rod shape-determining protein MreC [Prevotellaceae bacterium]